MWKTLTKLTRETILLAARQAANNEKARSGLLRAGFSKLPRQRPTLAQAIQALPSALQRFTAVFGMGTGGTTAAKLPGNLKLSGVAFRIRKRTAGPLNRADD
jgi:hypothetical protein